LSVLYESLAPHQVRTATHYCPLRLGWRGEVVTPNPGTQFAASIALMSAAVKIGDHLADGDGWLNRFHGLFQRLADCWRRMARQSGAALGFNLKRVESQAEAQLAVEADRGCAFLHYSRPTEEAVGSACGQVGVLAGCEERVSLLQRIGQLFGRAMYLLDAYRDYAADLAQGKFNPLAHSFVPAQIRPGSRALFDEAHGEIRTRLDDLRLPYPTLARRLLVDQLAEVGRETLSADTASGPIAPADSSDNSGPAPNGSEPSPKRDEQKQPNRKRRRRRQGANDSSGSSILCFGPGDPDCSDLFCCYLLSGDCCNCSAAGVECCATGQTADCCAAGAGGADCCAGADCAGSGAECCAGAACT
jgi:hypothetical protein